MKICFIQHFFSPPTKHIQNDIRQYIPLSTFGFYQHGWLMVEIKEFALQHGAENKIVSFAIDPQKAKNLHHQLFSTVSAFVVYSVWPVARQDCFGCDEAEHRFASRQMLSRGEKYAHQ